MTDAAVALPARQPSAPHCSPCRFTSGYGALQLPVAIQETLGKGGWDPAPLTYLDSLATRPSANGGGACEIALCDLEGQSPSLIDLDALAGRPGPDLRRLREI